MQFQDTKDSCLNQLGMYLEDREIMAYSMHKTSKPLVIPV